MQEKSDPQSDVNAAGVTGLKIPSSLPIAGDEEFHGRSGSFRLAVDKTSSFSRDLRMGSSGLVFDERSFDRLRMPRAPHWAIVWSDLMMTMFIFFVVLYIYQSSPEEVFFGEGPGFDIGSNVGSGVMGMKGGGAIGPAGEAAEVHLQRMYDLGRQALDGEELAEFARIDLSPDKTVRIILTGDLLFDSGQADIKDMAVQSLKKIVPLVSDSPYMINVVGHTDDVPISNSSFPSNWELSLIRAGNIARFLMAESHLDPQRFYVTGHASFDPLAPNDTSANRAANRRVEIILTKEKPSITRSGAMNEE